MPAIGLIRKGKRFLTFQCMEELGILLHLVPLFLNQAL